MTLTNFPRPLFSHASRQGNPNRQVGPTVPREQGERQEGAWQGQGQVGQSEAGGPGKMASHSMLPWLGGFVRKAFCPLGPYWPLPPRHAQPGLTVLGGQTPASPTACSGRTP